MDTERQYGDKPSLKWIETENLFVDHRYQRSVDSQRSQKNISFIKENFSWARFGALVVAENDNGKYFVLDGQHRLCVAERLCIESLPCVVVNTDTMSDQALDFVGVNVNRVKLTSLAEYHALVAAGDPDAYRLSKILIEADIEIPKSPVMKGLTEPRQTQAVKSLIKMLDFNTKAEIIKILNIIPDAYGDEKGQMRASLLKTLSSFVNKYPDFDYDHTIEVLLEFDPKELQKSARDYVAIHGGRPIDAMVKTVERIYNTKARGTEIKKLGVS